MMAGSVRAHAHANAQQHGAPQQRRGDRHDGEPRRHREAQQREAAARAAWRSWTRAHAAAPPRPGGDQRHMAMMLSPAASRCPLLKARQAGRQASQRPAISSVTCSGTISSGARAEQRRLVLVGQRDLDHLVALPADGEGELAVAGAMAAGDEGRARLEPVHHALLHQLVQRAIDRGRMGDAGGPAPGRGWHRRSWAPWPCAGRQDLALIARQLGFVVVMGGVHAR